MAATSGSLLSLQLAAFSIRSFGAEGMCALLGVSTSDGRKLGQGHKTKHCLLCGVRVELPNRVWCAAISYLPICLD